MRAIVRTETQLGCGTTTELYIPEGGAEYATDKEFYETMEKLYQSDIDYYGDQVEENEIWSDDLTAHVYTTDYSISYEVAEIKTA